MKRLNKIFCVLLIISLIFTTLYNISYATSGQENPETPNSSGQISGQEGSGTQSSSKFTDEMKAEIKNWVDKAQKTIKKYVYNDDNGRETNTYAVVMPEPSGNIGFDSRTREVLL